ncbi:MAG: TIGR04255 family protein [Actinomycetota bacterium]|nr:TIGR04255 family protein [Actinomycetota bacterium]
MVAEHPPLISVVGLRYINRVDIPEPDIRFEDYLTITLGFPAGFPRQVNAFLDRTDMSYDGEPVRLSFTWASVEAPPDTTAFILDLDFYFTPETPVDLAAARAALEGFKVKEGRAFEGLLQDRLRRTFREIA